CTRGDGSYYFDYW
nr:immunoglobulin heavy chain junction region [Mus musculus]NSM09395.1 immunoglobulin heavy chain junction region [Mus musculus]